MAKRRGYDITNDVVSIEPREKSTRRESRTVFLVEKSFLLEESMNDDGLGGARSVICAVVIEVLISVIAVGAWFCFR
jgi:hypothetical protein